VKVEGAAVDRLHALANRPHGVEASDIHFEGCNDLSSSPSREAVLTPCFSGHTMRRFGADNARYSASLPISQARIIQPTADIIVAAVLFIDSAPMLKLRLRGNSRQGI
jgi:hypothetical protein